MAIALFQFRSSKINSNLVTKRTYQDVRSVEKIMKTLKDWGHNFRPYRKMKATLALKDGRSDYF